MHDEVTLLDEDFPAQLRASFPDRRAARQAVYRLETLAGCEQLQVRVISPEDREAVASADHQARRDEPGRGRRKFIRGSVLGLAGGVCLGLLYLAIGPAAGSHAAHLMFSVSLFGALAGLLMAALLDWRSARWISAPGLSRTDVPGSGWLVVVTAHDLARHYEARRILVSLGGKDIRPV